ncbi:MAG: hypothetical protein LPD71_11910 [Shewanella sp.]|nr:hypothetical protein [Shewanella sp.]MCF1429512.1 hypothetical protein [Shewanella sp.]MCF1439413.1 hypothetical protein [Shewanella sp.]MCF1457696.1 hypothetical protein [Shewanella sp.]
MTLAEVIELNTRDKADLSFNIKLLGNLILGRSAVNPKGKTRVFYNEFPINGKIQISTYHFTGSSFDDIYWLPWKDKSVESVSWEQLELSGCSCFLTSELTGCRLTITDRGIVHTAFVQNVWGAIFLCQYGRDTAEADNPIASGRMIRRWSCTDRGGSYGANAVGGVERDMLVCAYKTGPRTWEFKLLSFNKLDRAMCRVETFSYTYGGAGALG